MSRFVSTLGEQVAELTERAAEAGRLSRGRTLFRKGSVSDLSIMEGSLIASVRGSEGDEYETTVGTAPAPPGVTRQIVQAQDSQSSRSVDDLAAEGLDVCPREIDLAFGCDCADWEEPCKHVVAVLLAFADRVDLDEAELLRWRGIDLAGPVGEQPEPQRRSTVVRRSGQAPRSRSGAKSETAPGSRRPVEPSAARREGSEPPTGSDPAEDPVDRTARLSELQALLGDTAMQVSTDEPGDGRSAAPSLDPAFLRFLGVGATLDPIDVSEINVPAPLFADVQLGPLGDLGPELATALSIIRDRLKDGRQS